MNLEEFTRRTHAGALREAAQWVRDHLDKISRRNWHPVADDALRQTSDRLLDKARSLEKRED